MQATLQRETVIWKRGLLVMPQIVHDLLDAMEVTPLRPLDRPVTQPAPNTNWLGAVLMQVATGWLLS